MQTVVDYQILDSGTSSGLARKVKKSLADSWQPLGGCISAKVHENTTQVTDRDLTMFYQTMVKFE